MGLVLIELSGLLGLAEVYSRLSASLVLHDRQYRMFDFIQPSKFQL